MREKEYTGTWSLHFQAPYVRHGRIVYRPVFHETVGRLGAKRFFSYFADDMPYQPKETPVLTGMLENNLAVFDNLEDGKLSKNIVLQYNVCRQCSRIFTAEKANKLYCPECAKERKREADRYAREKRKRNMKKGSKKQNVIIERPSRIELFGKKIGNLTVTGIAREQGDSSLWFCECECGQSFTAYESALVTGMIQECPFCTNKKAGVGYVNESILDIDLYSEEIDLREQVMMRRFGFIEAKAKLNNEIVLCNCGCGARFFAPLRHLLSGELKSCGCLSTIPGLSCERKSRYVGMKAGGVVVLKATGAYRGENKRRITEQWFLCRCLYCGNEFYCTRGKLCSAFSHGTETSFTCGCHKPLAKTPSSILTYKDETREFDPFGLIEK